MNFNDLLPDNRSQLVSGCKSFESYLKSFVPHFHLKEQVPDLIKKEFQSIKDLVKFSYYNYDLLDVAQTVAAITLEKSLNIRLIELGLLQRQSYLSKSLPIALENELLGRASIEKYDVLRELRNFKVHETKNMTLGINNIDLIIETAYAINDLYESKELRTVRNESLKEIQKWIDHHIKDEVIVEYKGKTNLAYKLKVFFVNNKIDKVETVFGWLLSSKNELDNPDSLFFGQYLPLSQIEFSSSKPFIKAIDKDNNIIIFRKPDELESQLFNFIYNKLNNSSLDKTISRQQLITLSLQTIYRKFRNNYLQNFYKL